MKIIRDVTLVEVFFDGGCGFCRRAVASYQKLRAGAVVEYIPNHTPGARERFPELDDYEPERQMVLRVNRKVPYAGTRAVIFLLELIPYLRPLAWVMTRKWLFPVVNYAYVWLTEHRYEVSKLLFGENGCAAGACEIGGKR